MIGKNIALMESTNYSIHKSSQENCIFISHKKSDEEIAVALGNYITNVLEEDIYLDFYDYDLQEAVSTRNDEAIVASIQKGISCSTHMICIISDETRVSWWVPYEIGYAEKNLKNTDDKAQTGNENIASAKVASINDIPSFLKIKRTITSAEELVDFLKCALPYGGLLKQYTDDGTGRGSSEKLSSEYAELLKYFG